jgi:DNA-binding transcriptional MerR regulator
VRNRKSQRGSFSSGELAGLVGVSADTLRHYERMGVLARPRRALNGYREYPVEALERVKLVRRALAVGFTLNELSGILSVRDAGGAPCHSVRALAAGKLTDIESRLRDLMAVREELRLTLRHWDARLSEVEPGTRAGLLETLAAGQASKSLIPLAHFKKYKKRGSTK